MVDLKIALHVFMGVLVIGSLWRLVSYHAIASGNPQLEHLGAAMSFQY